MRAVVLLTPEACRVVVWECCVSSPLLQLTVTCTEGTCLCQESMAAQLAQGPWLSSGLSNPFHPSVSVTTVSLSIHWCCRLSYRRASCSSFIVCCGPLLLVFKEKTDEMTPDEWVSLQASTPLLWLLMTSLPFASVRGNVNLFRNFGQQRARDLIFTSHHNRHLAILKPPHPWVISVGVLCLRAGKSR